MALMMILFKASHSKRPVSISYAIKNINLNYPKLMSNGFCFCMSIMINHNVQSTLQKSKLDMRATVEGRFIGHTNLEPHDGQ